MNKKEIFLRLAFFPCMAVLFFSLFIGCTPTADKVGPKNQNQQTQLPPKTFSQKFAEVISQRERIDQNIPSPTTTAPDEKFTKELQQKILSGELKFDQFKDEMFKQVNKELSDYAKKKQAYIQNVNKQANLLQQDIGKLPEQEQPLAKQALNDFITLTNNEIKLFGQMPKLLETIDFGKIFSKANEPSNIVRKIFCVTPVYAAAQPSNCNCQVTTQYLNPRLVRVTTTCVCKIYVEYQKTFQNVLSDQKKFTDSLVKFIEYIKQNVKPKEISTGKYQTKDGATIQGKVIKQVNAVDKIQPTTEKIDLSTVAKVRKELGIPAIGDDFILKKSGYLKSEQTIAVLKADNVKIWGRNGWGVDQGGYKEMKKEWLKSGGNRDLSATNNQTVFHAEGDAFWNLYQYRKKHNILGGTGTLAVDRPFCTACGDSRGVQQLMEEVGLDKLVVITPAGEESITPRPGKQRKNW
jgi:hypothetical protein